MEFLKCKKNQLFLPWKFKEFNDLMQYSLIFWKNSADNNFSIFFCMVPSLKISISIKIFPQKITSFDSHFIFFIYQYATVLTSPPPLEILYRI
jgi:hypothetical protein